MDLAWLRRSISVSSTPYCLLDKSDMPEYIEPNRSLNMYLICHRRRKICEGEKKIYMNSFSDQRKENENGKCNILLIDKTTVGYTYQAASIRARLPAASRLKAQPQKYKNRGIDI